ncbi:MAG: VOC family protein [Acidimicrobiales bacterium]
MADMRTYPSGVPCWIDSEQTDPAAACHFYGTLFGWTFEEAMPPGAPGSYLIAQLDGDDVAAIAPSAEAKAAWNTYIAVDDADAASHVVMLEGGGLLQPAQDAGQAGRSAIFIDPTDAQFRVWQPRRRLGAQVVNGPGAWNFSDLHTADTASAQAFYGRVFGWQPDDLDLGDGQTSTMWRRPGYGDHLAATVDPDIHERQAAISAPPGFADAIAWLAALDEGEQPHWHVTFAVADRDEVVASALRLGASDLQGPIDTAWTKAAIICDPQGATFTVSQFTPPAG